MCSENFKVGIFYKLRLNGCDVRHFPAPWPPTVGGGLGNKAGQDHSGREGSLSSSTCTSCVTCTLIAERSGLVVRFFGGRTRHLARSLGQSGPLGEVAAGEIVTAYTTRALTDMSIEQLPRQIQLNSLPPRMVMMKPLLLRVRSGGVSKTV